MAISNATRLSDFGSGIGTQGAIIQVNNATQRVGIGTTNPDTTLEVLGTFKATTLQLTNLLVTGIGTLGAGVTAYGYGIVSATSYRGDGSELTGIAVTDYINTNSVNSSGIITASSFEGDGSSLTGVSGFGTALNATQDTLGNLVYKTPRRYYVAAGLTAYLRSDATSGNMLFSRLSEIHVGSGATIQIGTGTTMIMDVLNIF